MSIQTAKRIFKYDDQVLDDTNPNLPVSAILEQYSTVYPELTNATIQGPEIKKGELHYEFKVELGSKG